MQKTVCTCVGSVFHNLLSIRFREWIGSSLCNDFGVCSIKRIWKCPQQNCAHFVQTSECLFVHSWWHCDREMFSVLSAFCERIHRTVSHNWSVMRSFDFILLARRRWWSKVRSFETPRRVCDVTVLQWRHIERDGVTRVSIVCWTVCSGADQENIKAQRHWTLWGESTGHRWIPLTKGQLRGKMLPFDDAIMVFFLVGCAVRNGGCSHLCEVDQVGLHCGCRQGFILAPDRRTCVGEWSAWKRSPHYWSFVRGIDSFTVPLHSPTAGC